MGKLTLINKTKAEEFWTTSWFVISWNSGKKNIQNCEHSCCNVKLNVEVEENANLLFDRAVLDHAIESGSIQFDPGLILAGWNKGNTLREIQLEPLQGYLTEFSHLDSEVYATAS